MIVDDVRVVPLPASSGLFWIPLFVLGTFLSSWLLSSHHSVSVPGPFPSNSAFVPPPPLSLLHFSS